MKILLVDDHGIMRAGVKTLILHAYPHADIIEAGYAEQAIQLAEDYRPDLVFLDLSIPQQAEGMESVDVGLATLSKLRESELIAPVVVMSGDKSRDIVDMVLERGASSFVPKTASQEVMFEAIRRALGGGVYLPSDEQPIAGTVAEGGLPEPVTPQMLGLTRREFDVLRLALQGNPPWKIALILGINATNVRRYLSRMYEKFGVIDLCGLQGHFARTGQVFGIMSAASIDAAAARPAQMAS